MKKTYQNAKVEVLAPAVQDMITTSGLRNADANQVNGAKGAFQSFNDGSFSNPV